MEPSTALHAQQHSSLRIQNNLVQQSRLLMSGLVPSQGLDDLTSLQSAQKGRRPAAGDRRPELSWLMRTSYISGEVDAGRRPRKRPKVAEEPAAEPEEATRESLIAAIEVHCIIKLQFGSIGVSGRCSWRCSVQLCTASMAGCVSQMVEMTVPAQWLCRQASMRLRGRRCTPPIRVLRWRKSCQVHALIDQAHTCCLADEECDTL